MKNIAIFASGSGTNAANLIDTFAARGDVRVCRVYCNVPGAGVIDRAESRNIPVTIVDRDSLRSEDGVVRQLRGDDTSLIVLAGFLWLMPETVTVPYAGRIVNIHPALLPAYGGKGMYGMNVHRAVLDAAEERTGITIHYVNGRYDEGDIIFQAECRVMPDDTPETLAARVQDLEYRHLPEVVLSLLEG